MKVLVADDNEMQRRLFGGLLKDLGLEIVEAASGADALDQLLRADGPHVALLDWEMPALSGVEVVQKVREASLDVRPHLLLVTARTDRADVVQALQAGADDFISKPPHPPELRARVMVGVRNVKLQQELQVRIDELKSTLRRLDVVGALAAQAAPQGPRAAKEGALQPATEALDAVRGLPERMASVIGNLGEATGQHGRPELWAHLALALPQQGSWLDVTLEVSRALASAAVEKLIGQRAANDQALLDAVGDVLTLVMRGFQQQLEAHGVSSLKPYPSRGFVGTVQAPATPFAQALAHGGWTLRLFETPAEARAAPFASLEPGSMLVSSLVPPHLPTVEVLAKATVLKPSYLTRAASFFKGDAVSTPVTVMSASGFALQHR